MDMNQAKQLFPSYYKSKELERILEVDEGKEFNVYRICKKGILDRNAFIPSNEEFSNIEIANCEFRNGGTSADVNDCGGDGILIIDPPALSYNINIHDNKFTNWGRWAFAIDLGGHGERIEGLKFNNNICIAAIGS